MADPRDIADRPQAAEATPLFTSALWTSRRRSLHEAFAARDEPVADLYRYAVNALGERPLSPGGLVVASHCLRELTNRLPRVLGEVELPGYQSERPAADALRDALEQAGLSVTSDEPETGESVKSDTIAPQAADLPESVVVPRAVLDAALAVVQANRGGTSRAHGMRQALVLGAQTGGGASTLKVVKEAVDTFEGFRHPSDNDVTTWLKRGPDYFVAKLEVIEQALRSRLGRFFDIVTDLRHILAKANEQRDGHWIKPTTQAVRSILPMLADPQHRAIFYRGLANPLWLEPLNAVGAFSDPPIEPRGENEAPPYQAWPQGDYLRLMAPMLPMEVANLLARYVSDKSALHARETALVVAGEVPAGAAALLESLVIGCIGDERLRYYLDTEVVKVIEVLAQGSNKQRTRAMRIAEALLAPRLVRPAKLYHRGEVDAAAENHSYDETLAKVVAAFGGRLEILKALVWWLDSEQTLSGTFEPPDRDLSASRRPSISDHSQNYRFDTISDALVDSVRDTSIELIRTLGPGPVLKVLRSPQAIILTRVELYALSQTVGRTDENAAVAEQVLPYVVERLNDQDLADRSSTTRELEQLAAEALPLLDDDSYTRWEQNLLDGPDLDDQERERISKYLRDRFSPEDAVAYFVERGQLHHLAAIGEASLRPRTRALLRELTAKHGEIAHPGFRSWRSGWTGRDPDGLMPDLRAMDPNEVLTGLASPAEHAEAGFDTATDQREALTHAFSDAVSRHTGAYSALTKHVLSLPPGFINSFLSELRSHIDRTTNRPDPEVGEKSTEPQVNWLALLEALRTSDVWRENAADESSEIWRWVREAICSLIEVAAERNVIPADLLPAAFEIVAAMTRDTDPTPEREAQYGGVDKDPFTFAMNAVRPSAIRTMLKVAKAAEASEEANSLEGSEPRPSVEITADALARTASLLVPKRDHSLTLAAVLGEEAGWIIGSASDWLEEHRPQLLSNDEFGDVFVTTALATHLPHPRLLTLCAAAIEDMLRRLPPDDIANGAPQFDSPLRLVGNHLTNLYLSGLLALDDPLFTLFFENATIEERSATLDHIGWAFSGTIEIKADVVHRAKDLWDHRMEGVRAGKTEPAELAQFESWIRCGRFEVEWWLPHLSELAENYSFDGRAHIGDELIAAAEVDLNAALNVLKHLLSAPRRLRALPYGLRIAAPAVLALALDSGISTLVTRADDLLNQIGRDGDISIQDEVESRRKPTAE